MTLVVVVRRARFTRDRSPRNMGVRYPADPPTVEEIVAVMRSAGDTAYGRRLRGLIVVLWRAGLRINEALALAPDGSGGGRAASIRAAPAPPRSCGGDGPCGVPLIVIQRQLGHSNVGITSIHLQGIDNAEIIDTVHGRSAPVVQVGASLRL